MFCPNCGTQLTAALKFCRRCGSNLLGVRDAMTRGTSESFDWGKTWVAEMLMSQSEHDRRKGVTAETKRINEIKGGIITAAAGLGAMIFLKYLLTAVAANEPEDAEILLRVWIVGLVPFLIGLSIIFNGVFLSKRIVKEAELQQQQSPTPSTAELTGPERPELREAPPIEPLFSVAEASTQRIPDSPEQKPIRDREGPVSS